MQQCDTESCVQHLYLPELYPALESSRPSSFNKAHDDDARNMLSSSPDRLSIAPISSSPVMHCEEKEHTLLVHLPLSVPRNSTDDASTSKKRSQLLASRTQSKIIYPAPAPSHRLFQPFKPPTAGASGTKSVGGRGKGQQQNKSLAVEITKYENQLKRLRLARKYQLADLFDDPVDSLDALRRQADEWQQAGREAAEMLFEHTCVGVETVEDAVKSKRTFEIAFADRFAQPLRPTLAASTILDEPHYPPSKRARGKATQAIENDDFGLGSSHTDTANAREDEDLPDPVELSKGYQKPTSAVDSEEPVLVPRPMRVRDNKLESLSDLEDTSDDSDTDSHKKKSTREPASQWTIRKMLKAQQIPASLFWDTDV